jgi:hypothetical protein
VTPAISRLSRTTKGQYRRASVRADSRGDFKVAASGYVSSTCKATVSDGNTTAVVTLSGCTVTPPPHNVPALTLLSLSHTSLSAVGTIANGQVRLAALTPAPLTVSVSSSHPTIARVALGTTVTCPRGPEMGLRRLPLRFLDADRSAVMGQRFGCTRRWRPGRFRLVPFQPSDGPVGSS